MRFLSTFSGIEAASLAWGPLGWRAVGFSEINPFCCALLAQRFPDVPNFGDITRIAEWPTHEPVDVVCGGSPCQSFSIAGLRDGLADPRGALIFAFLAAVARARPRWVVYENVPGILSADDGRAFGSLLRALAELGYGFAYRVLDAQYAGVPQRRRRVFLVGHLGDWRRAAAVLFERQSLQGDHPPRRSAQQAPAGTLAGGARGRGGQSLDDIPLAATQAFDTANCLTARMGKGINSSVDEGQTPVIVFDPQQITSRENRSNPQSGAPCHTLAAHHEAPILAFKASHFTRGKDGAPSDVSPPLTAEADKGDQDPLVLAFDCKAGAAHMTFADGVSPTLRAHGTTGKLNSGGHVAIGIDLANQHATVDVAATMRTADGEGRPAALAGMRVRRLTPVECERLQGMPDVRNSVTLIVCCSDQEASRVRAAIRDHRSPSFAWPADAAVWTPSAAAVDWRFSTLLPGLAPHAARHALLDFERMAVLLRSPARSNDDASSADDDRWSLRAGLEGAFARALALLPDVLASGVRSGEAVSRPSSERSGHPQSGSALAVVCGREIGAPASDADAFTKRVSDLSRFTTSARGASSPSSASLFQTWCCCVASAICGSIPEPTRSACSFAVRLETVGGWTLIQYRGKPAKDGPRYKAIGNSWAIPDVRWIGQRIMLVDGIG